MAHFMEMRFAAMLLLCRLLGRIWLHLCVDAMPLFQILPSTNTAHQDFRQTRSFFDHPCIAFSKHAVFHGIRAVSVRKPHTFPGRRCCNYRVRKFFPSQYLKQRLPGNARGLRTDTARIPGKTACFEIAFLRSLIFHTQTPRGHIFPFHSSRTWRRHRLPKRSQYSFTLPKKTNPSVELPWTN